MLLGFDIGGTKCAVCIGRKTGDGLPEVVDKVILPTADGPAVMMDLLFHHAARLLGKHGFANGDIDGIGISCGGPLNSKTGTILSPPNLPGWDNVAIVAIAEQRFGRRAVLQNDANACAVAEWKYGAGRGYDDVVFLTFGTGMGAGLILNGQLYAGSTDGAGEAGHIRLRDNGPVGFGKVGSFEGFCSGGGIAQLAQTKARELLRMGEKPSFSPTLEDVPKITAKSVAEAAYSGDAAAIDIYGTSGRYLGRGLAILIDLLNPQAIIIGGIYTRAQSLLEPQMREALAQEALPGALSACRIVPAALNESIGDMAALALADMASA